MDVCKTIVGGLPREVASVRKRGSPGEFRAVTPNFLDVVKERKCITDPKEEER